MNLVELDCLVGWRDPVERADVEPPEASAGNDLVAAGDDVVGGDRNVREGGIQPGDDAAEAFGTATSRGAMVDAVGVDYFVDGRPGIALGDELKGAERGRRWCGLWW